MPDERSAAVRRISVILPAFNEDQNIVKTVGRALEAMRSLGCPFEILIVNDASRDATGRLADDLARDNPEVRVLHNPRNLGQGGSIVSGFRQARYELVIHNAMDYPFDLRDLAQMLPLLDEADIVVAARDCRAGYTLTRKFMSAVNRLLLRFLFGLKLRDFNFVQLYPRRVWECIQVESRSTAFITPEALIRAHDMGLRIAEVSARYHPREKGQATSGNFRVVFRSVRDLLAFWWKRSIGGRQRYWSQISERRLERQS